jgi:lipopolysaccharide assembly outer membrane protein LptD (OstA)
MNKTKSTLIFLPFLIFLFFCASSSAEEAAKEPIQLLNADLSELRFEEDNIIVNLIGNVTFKHGELNLRSHRAVWYRTAGQVVFIDSVRIEDPDQVLTADRVTYYRNSRKMVADGDVELYSKKEDAKITGGHGEYDRIEKLAVFTLSPSLILKPDRADSTVTVTAELLEYHVEEEKGIAREKVRISKSDLLATCDEADWMNRENKILLTGNPEAEKQNDRLTGEKMDIFIENEKVSQIIVEGEARASHLEIDSLSQTQRESFLGAKRMIFFLEDETLERVKASGNATSLYHPENTRESGQDQRTDKNVASGDTIDLFLSDDKLNRVQIQGGAMGTYTFQGERGKENPEVEDTIWYSAERIDYRIDEKLITLREESSLKYDQVSLTAGKITYHTTEQILVAESIKSQEGEKQSQEGSPVLQDGDDRIEGERMSYDLRSRRGKVKAGVTNIQRGTYRGELLRKITDEVLLADRCFYTTCDSTKPYYTHFYARKMKIIAKDKVIAQPVVMYIGHLPVFAIPFYVFPIKPGRHSGFLTFDIGNLEAGQRFVRNLGYYWALSDYWDLKTAFDYYEGSGWMIKSRARYKKRYVLEGWIEGSYNHQSRWNLSTLTKSRSERWDLKFNHRQTISPTLSASASGTFLSDKDYWRDLNLDPAERRNRSLHSQANISKRWSSASAVLALDHTWNLDTDYRTLSLPFISFSRSSLPLIPAKESDGGEIQPRWYNSIYYTFSSNFVNYQFRQKSEEDFNRKKFMVSDNRVALSAPQKLFGWLVLSPGLNFQETWYYVFRTNLSESYPIPGNSSARRGTFSTNLSAKTVLYGTFHPRVGNLVGIRHVMTPTVNFTWQPEFKRKQEYLSFTGRGGSGAKSQAMNFSLSNLLQTKTKSVQNGEEVEKKLDLFTLNFRSGYNFLAEQHKLSNLTTALRSTAIRNVSLTFSSSHDFYDQTGDLNLLSPRWLSFSFDTRISLQGSWVEPAGIEMGSQQEQSPEDMGAAFPGGPGESTPERTTQSWSLNLSHRYSEVRGGSEVHWITASLSLPLTRRLHLRYHNRYDLSEEKITEQTFEFYRDMHCWEARFTWIATGYREGYYFRFNIKALPEIKVEKSRGGLREVFF